MTREVEAGKVGLAAKLGRTLLASDDAIHTEVVSLYRLSGQVDLDRSHDSAIAHHKHRVNRAMVRLNSDITPIGLFPNLDSLARIALKLTVSTVNVFVQCKYSCLHSISSSSIPSPP